MILYLDTSSLVKLYLAEDDSLEVEELVGKADIVSTSVVALPEARGAFARLTCEGTITSEELTAIRAAFLADWGSLLKIRALERVCHRAGDLAEEHSLRGFDALHLASFVELLEQADEDGETVEFSAFDVRLNTAAEVEAERR